MPIHGFPGNVISATPPSVTVNGASGVFTTEQQMQYQAAGNWPMPLTQISRSLRFNSADSAYLNRTPASAGNKQTWTWSGWVKRGALSSFMPIYSAGPSSPRAFIAFSSADKLDYRSVDSTNTEVIRLVTTQVFRDPSAWYHIVVAQDTTQATAANRVKIYVNGVQVTAFSTETYPSQNASNLAINDALEQNYGRYVNSPSDGYLSAYITETYFIDGLALTPASFGVADQATGVWGPRQYTGPYGTNGFYLNFSDNSGTTSTTLGKDYSGNGNNWTPNNFSVTAGAGNDSLVDTPTPYGTDTGAGGEVRGNYATWNPLFVIPSNTTNTFANGNLEFTVTQAEGTGTATAASTMALPTTGKWYWEITPTTVATGNAVRTEIGIMNPTQAKYLFANDLAATDCYAYAASGVKVSGQSQVAYGNSYTANDVIGVAVDLDNGAIYFAKNNTWQNSGVPTSGSSKTGAAYTSLTGSSNYLAAVGYWGTYVANFGQRPFAYTAPSGFKALCTQNLPTPTIGATSTTQAGDYFNTVLYTGDGNATAQAITGVGFQPDFVWLKARSQTYEHILSDRVRGAGKILFSSLNNAESTVSNFVSFDSDGFTVNAAGGASSFNQNGTTYASWNWKANGAGSSNTAGSITSTVSVSTTAGFSIVTYTGTGANATVGHGLGVAPSMIITKNRSTTSQWAVYHSKLTSANYALLLDLTNAEDFSSAYWNSTAPTSTLFSVGGAGSTNGSGNNMVAYCFTPVVGYSAFGGYTGNGSSDGTFVYTGFRPACIIFKVSDGIASWLIHDNKRNTYNVVDKKLFPDSGDAEATADVADFLSNGFKLRGTNTQFNGNGFKYIYAAFAEFPFKYTLAR